MPPVQWRLSIPVLLGLWSSCPCLLCTVALGQQSLLVLYSTCACSVFYEVLFWFWFPDITFPQQEKTHPVSIREHPSLFLKNRFSLPSLIRAEAMEGSSTHW